MDKLYIKNEKGRYVEYGYSYNKNELRDGIWVVQSKPSVKNITSVMWLVGDLKRPCDIITHASLQTMSYDLTTYLRKLQDELSDEYIDAKEILGAYLQGAVQITNISSHDFAKLILRKIALLIESKNKSNDIHTV